MFYIQYAQGVECKHYLSVLSDHRTFNTKSSIWYLENPTRSTWNCYTFTTQLLPLNRSFNIASKGILFCVCVYIIFLCVFQSLWIPLSLWVSISLFLCCYLSLCLSLCMSLSVYVSLCVSFWLSVCLSLNVWLSLCVSLSVSVCLSILSLSVSLSDSVYISVCLSLYLSLCIHLLQIKANYFCQGYNLFPWFLCLTQSFSVYWFKYIFMCMFFPFSNNCFSNNSATHGGRNRRKTFSSQINNANITIADVKQKMNIRDCKALALFKGLLHDSRDIIIKIRDTVRNLIKEKKIPKY